MPAKLEFRDGVETEQSFPISLPVGSSSSLSSDTATIPLCPPPKKKVEKVTLPQRGKATDRRLHMIRLVFAKETKVKRLGMFFPTPKRHGKKRERWYMPRQQMGVRFLWGRWKEALQVPERSPEFMQAM